MKTHFRLLVLSTIILASCSHSPELEEVPDSTLADPLIIQLRNAKSFPIDYVDDAPVGKINVPVHPPETEKIQNWGGYTFGPSYFVQTAKKWDSNNHLNMIGTIQASSSNNVGFNASIERWTETFNYENFILWPATGIGLSSSTSTIDGICIGGRMLMGDGTLSATQWTSDPSLQEMSLQIPDVFSTTRVLIGWGATVRNGKVIVLWGYTAPFDPVSKRLLVNTVDDVHLLLKSPTKHNMSSSAQDIEVIYRTFDFIPEVNAFKRAFVTGIGAGTGGDDINQLGIKITVLDNQ
jgi:hypothetical protein